MDIHLSTGNSPVGRDTKPASKPTGRVSTNLISYNGLKRQFSALDSDDTLPLKQQVFSPDETGYPEDKIYDRSVTGLKPFFYSEATNPKKWIRWCPLFQNIYHSLRYRETSKIEALVADLSDNQIKCLLIATAPRQYSGEHQHPLSLFELATFCGESGNTLFRALFDRLSSEELRVALLEPNDDNITLLHHACCVMDERSFNLLEQKLDKQTLLEMLTRPVNDLAPPLAFACLFNKSTYLFDTVLHQNRELTENLLKGSPDIDQSILQFMCSDDVAHNFSCGRPSFDEHRQRISYLLGFLSEQDRFDAIRFTGKSDMSPLLWACTGNSGLDLACILTETFDEAMLAELFTAQAETGNSLVQQCLELGCADTVATLCMSFSNSSLRFKALSICTSEGHSLFKQWVLDFNCFNDLEDIEHMLRGIDDNHRNLLIAGDRSIWDQTDASTDLTLSLQKQTAIVEAMNREKIFLAEFLLRKVTDPELSIKLLLYKTTDQTTLLYHLLDNGAEIKWFNEHILKNTSSQIERDHLEAELRTYAFKAGRLDDARYYLAQISDPQLKYDLLKDNPEFLLTELFKKGGAITEDFFSERPPSQCTALIVSILENGLYDENPLIEHLPQLIALQEKGGDKEAFVKWATSMQQGKECPLITAMRRFARAHNKIDNPQYFWQIKIKKEVSSNKQIIREMIRMMSEEQRKAFFLSVQDKRHDVVHLLGNKDILATIVDALGEDSGRAFLEKINPITGANLLHILFESILLNDTGRKLKDLIKETIVWLDNTYGLASFCHSRLENDGSTPLHVLLKTVKQRRLLAGDMSRTLQEDILKQLCQPSADGIPLVTLLKLKDNDGCTPLHKLFACERHNSEIGNLLINELGLETFHELMHIKDNQNKSVMDHCSTLHGHLFEEYNRLFQTIPAAVNVQ
ncbi:hypothetical protein [Endozoicomonas sp. SCSIO W0465]|uniref:hypothetical protein n=1 Tax=Endozoicomonas sp. SCSIO W0465 TaxID=2918516 RepID=UPI002074D083|nr:hypothetical protein [Endozoicomonas sp. SCSIO W0465]USE35944.1 hypothetical protein MJO57_28435 [Endozoicomonas sp. SCSIO W0465]